MKFIVLISFAFLLILLIPIASIVAICVLAIPFGLIGRMDIYEKIMGKIDKKIHLTSAWKWWGDHIYNPIMEKTDKYKFILFILFLVWLFILKFSDK